MRKRLIIYCEGQTEEVFVERLWRDHLSVYGVRVERPILAATTFDPKGQRGGFVNWDAMEFDLQVEFASDADPDLRFTTLLDVYAMPEKVLRLAGFSGSVVAVADIEAVERAMEKQLAEPRFTAYFQRHEMEALLLADLDALERVFHRHRPGIQRMRLDIASFPTAEDINNGAATHPSARLSASITGYEDLKASNFYWTLAEAGLNTARRQCPRFNQWLTSWEKWGMNP